MEQCLVRVTKACSYALIGHQKVPEHMSEPQNQHNFAHISGLILSRSEFNLKPHSHTRLSIHEKISFEKKITTPKKLLLIKSSACRKLSPPQTALPTESSLSRAELVSSEWFSLQPQLWTKSETMIVRDFHPGRATFLCGWPTSWTFSPGWRDVMSGRSGHLNYCGAGLQDTYGNVTQSRVQRAGLRLIKYVYWKISGMIKSRHFNSLWSVQIEGLSNERFRNMFPATLGLWTLSRERLEPDQTLGAG